MYQPDELSLQKSDKSPLTAQDSLKRKTELCLFNNV